MTTYEMRILACCMNKKRTFGYLRKRFRLKTALLQDILTKRLAGYIDFYPTPDPKDNMDNATCVITMEGFLVAKDFYYQRVTAWAPIVIAVVSLIISIVVPLITALMSAGFFTSLAGA